MHKIVLHLVTGDFLDLFSAGATLGLLYMLLAIAIIIRYRRTDRSPSGHATPVTVLKPLHGVEPHLQSRLASLCDQAYSGPFQIVFGCQDRNDPVIAVVDAVRRERRSLDLALVVDARSYGLNGKISNLVNMHEAARYGVLAVSDSDIEVDSTYLSKIVAPLEHDDVGAVTCLYHGVPGDAVAAWLSALAINAHFLPNVVAAVALRLAKPCFGATIAMRRETLDGVGGFRAFADKLADDYAIGEAVRATGRRVVIPTFTLGHACNERTFADFFRHQLRCARTIRSVDPFGHAGAFIGNPFPLALIGALQGSEESLWLAGALIACRVAMCKITERKFELPRQRLWLLPATDVLLFVVYVCSFFGSSVTWRGHRYRIVSDGTLSRDRS